MISGNVGEVFGGVAQSVERSVRNAEAVGSIPITSTFSHNCVVIQTVSGLLHSGV